MLKKFLASLGLAAILSLNGFVVKSEENKSETYVISYVAMNENNPQVYDDIKPIDVNCSFLVQANTYEEFLKAGVDRDKIYLMYPGEPDFSEKKDKSAVRKTKRAYDKGSYRDATRNDLEEVIQEVSERADNNDWVVIQFQAHGGYYSVQLQDGGLHYKELREYLATFEGNVLFVSDSCYSGNFIYATEQPNAILVGTERNRSHWVDRNGSLSQTFFEEMNNKKNDFNHDGKVTVSEAYETTVTEREAYGESIQDFLLNDYYGENTYPELKVYSLSFTPMIKVGEDTEDFSFDQ